VARVVINLPSHTGARYTQINCRRKMNISREITAAEEEKRSVCSWGTTFFKASLASGAAWKNQGKKQWDNWDRLAYCTGM